MVNSIGSAAQQISTNLSKLKETHSFSSKSSDTDDLENSSNHSAKDSRAATTSTNLGSKVSQGLLKLKQGSINETLDGSDRIASQNGVDVSLSKEARIILQNS